MRPIWSCSMWGLPCLPRYRRSGALLPHLFTLTPRIRSGMFSVALSVAPGSPDSFWDPRKETKGIQRRPRVTWHIALWSSDFPPRSRLAGPRRSSRPAKSNYKGTGRRVPSESTRLDRMHWGLFGILSNYLFGRFVLRLFLPLGPVGIDKLLQGIRIAACTGGAERYFVAVGRNPAIEVQGRNTQ